MNINTWVEVPGALLAAEYAALPPATAHANPAAAPLLYLHAGVADGRMWHAQWAAGAQTHTQLRYDRRGFGASRTLAATPYSRTADLWAVMDAVGLQQAVLVGCSQGGRVALDAALARPERVRALVLVAPAVSGAPAAEPGGAVQALSAAMDAAEAARDWPAMNQLEAHLWLDGLTSPRGRVGGAARELFLAMNDIALRAADPGPVTEEQPAWGRLEQLRVPTLVLWGDLDLPHLQLRCQTLVQRIPGAQRVVLEGTAHLPGLEAPARFNTALAAWLATTKVAP
jgi:pimeloyl-ACP methyl ester carboxylesterase